MALKLVDVKCSKNLYILYYSIILNSFSSIGGYLDDCESHALNPGINGCEKFDSLFLQIFYTMLLSIVNVCFIWVELSSFLVFFIVLEIDVLFSDAELQELS